MTERILASDPRLITKLRRRKGKVVNVMFLNRCGGFSQRTSGRIKRLTRSRELILMRDGRRKKGFSNERTVKITPDLVFHFEA